MKKIISSVLVLFMMLSVTPIVFASDTMQDLPPEIQQFYDEVEEQNKLAEQKWQEALAQSKREKNEYEALLETAARQPATYVYRSATAEDMQPVTTINFAMFYHTANFNTSIVNGNEIITSVSRVSASRRSSKDYVGDYSSQKTIIDLGRTLAVNCSMTVGKQSADGIWYYLPIQRYVEFYYNGQANVYGKS